MKKLLQKAFDTPFGYPKLSEAVYPGDRVVLAPDQYAAAESELLAAVVEQVVDSGVEPENITVLFDASETGEIEQIDVICNRLPKAWRNKIVFHGFSPHASDGCSILCLDLNGEPVALARPLVDADVVLPIERHWPNPPLGHFGMFSALVPRFSDLATRIRFQAADAEKKREKIVASFAEELASAARQIGVGMVLEFVTEPNGSIRSLLFGSPEAVAEQLAPQQPKNAK